MKTVHAFACCIICLTVCSFSAATSFAQAEFRKQYDTTATTKPVDKIFLDEGWVRSVAYSPDSQRLAVGVKANPLLILDATTGKTVKSIAVPMGIRNFDTLAAYSPDGKLLALSWGGRVSEESKYAIQLYNAETFAVEKTIEAFDYSPIQMEFAGNERLLLKFEHVQPSYENYVLLNLKDGTSREVAKSKDGDWPTVAASPDGKTLAVGISRSLKLLDSETLQEIDAQRTVSTFGKLHYSADGKTLFVDLFGELLSYDSKTKTLTSIAKKEGDDRGNWYCSYGPGGISLIAVIHEKLTAVDLKTGKRVVNSKVAGNFSATISPDGRQVIIRKPGMKIEAWEPPSAAAKQKPKPAAAKSNPK